MSTLIKKSPKHSRPICMCIPQIMIKTHAQWGLAWTPQSCLGISGCRLYNCTRSTIPIQLYVRHLTNAPYDEHLTYRIEHKSLLYNCTVDTQYPQSSLYQSVQESRHTISGRPTTPHTIVSESRVSATISDLWHCDSLTPATFGLSHTTASH